MAGLGTPRELIVVARPGVTVREAFAAAGGPGELQGILETVRATMRPLFVAGEDGVRGLDALGAAEAPIYYHVEAADERLDDLAVELLTHETVEAAYVKPAGEPPYLNTMKARSGPAPEITPDFSPRQGYLELAPGGVDARYAWTRKGGKGAGVRIIDLEWDWNLNHEDLEERSGGIVGGTMFGGESDHGTAVLGEIGGDHNGRGAMGIAPDTTLSTFGFSIPSASAIRLAADLIGPGDVMLLEIHRPGPRHNYEDREDQQGFIAIEWWPDDFDAIRYAISKGIIVVEAAGNGGENLDDPLYDTPKPGFTPGWTNPFKRSNRDSGAIVVGAGAPPPGTHGRDDLGPDRSRLPFSNYGQLIDAQGWGDEVTTSGYGHLQGGDDHNLWYTDSFGGTSGASPIVVGALACAQGILLANSRAPLTWNTAREILRATGSPQQDAPDRPATQRIGNRPDLAELIQVAWTAGATP